MASVCLLRSSRPRFFSSLLRPASSCTSPSSTRIPRMPSSTSSASPSRRLFSSYLVTPSELHQALQENPGLSTAAGSRVIPLCAAWFMPNDPRDGLSTFRELRIPKARFFDLDTVVDRHSEYPHMLPSAKTFAASMSELGIRREDTVVVYDSHETGIFSAPRVGWTLRAFGHPRVHVLNNFKLWVDQGLPIETGEFYSIECCQYPIPELDSTQVADFEEVKEVAQRRLGEFKDNDNNNDKNDGGDSEREHVQIIDARSHGRWTGRDPEPREGLSSGHMPGSINIAFPEVLDPKTKAFLPREQLAKLFEDKGVDPHKPVIATCGTGVTACIIETALRVSGYGKPDATKVYDGSWTEWAQRVEPSDGLIVKSKGL